MTTGFFQKPVLRGPLNGVTLPLPKSRLVHYPKHHVAFGVTEGEELCCYEYICDLGCWVFDERRARRELAKRAADQTKE